MEHREIVSRSECRHMDTRQLRETFLVDGLFPEGALYLVHWESDRAVIGSAVPGRAATPLATPKELAAEFFCERRELGAINLGAPGQVTVDGQSYGLGYRDALYVGRGSRDISFASEDPANPARYFLISYPAHATHPTRLARVAEARQIKLGSPETANCRTIYQYIHEDGIKSCQLVMGFTELDAGSVWNTMPPHTHLRRSEVYLYFNVPADAVVFHFMGPAEETRHLCMHSGQAVLSPPWSIHAGCGTRAYAFIWAMGGENQRFDDMDAISLQHLL